MVNFSILANYINELDIDISHLDVYGVIFVSIACAHPS
jgi:hypothetical protein